MSVVGAGNLYAYVIAALLQRNNLRIFPLVAEPLAIGEDHSSLSARGPHDFIGTQPAGRRSNRLL